MFNDIIIKNIPAISAVYFCLLQNGYDYFSFGRDEEHIKTVEGFRDVNLRSVFFAETRQNTCDVYPFWPRASMLESAVFYLAADKADFSDKETYRDKIMSAANISDDERDSSFWNWVNSFPKELINIMSSSAFRKYMEWENCWIERQNNVFGDKLKELSMYIEFCVENYDSPVKTTEIVLSPIKCVYSSDYHIVGGRFVFCSGDFSLDSVIHEFLHHVVHQTVINHKKHILDSKAEFIGIDSSYYLDGKEDGILNAFEEYFVRCLTERFISQEFPKDLENCIDELL